MFSKPGLPTVSGLLSLLLLSLACALSNSPQAVRSPDSLAGAATDPTATWAPFGGTPAPLSDEWLPAQNRFAPFSYRGRQTIPSATGPLEPADAAKTEELEILSEAQQSLLLSEGAVIVSRRFATFDQAYQQIGEQKIAFYISSDLILHSFQTLSDVTWQRTEAQYLVADLTALSAAMVGASLEQWETAQAEPIELAAWRNLAFFSVGSRLLDPSFTVPPPVAEIVEEELTLIEEGGTYISPLFGRQQDYTRYAPRGHYAAQDVLQGYFRAMLWFAQPLALETGDAASARQAALQAIQMTWAAIGSQNLSRWQRIHEPAVYFWGSDGRWSLHHVVLAAAAVFGEDADAADLEDVRRLDDFIATLHDMGRAPGLQPEPSAAFSFMPAPAYPDETILRELVFNRVGTYSGTAGNRPATAVETAIGTIRGLPRALDVPAVLSSDVARRLLEEAGDTAYDGYATQMAGLQSFYDEREQTAWTRTRDGAWLYALQPLLADGGAEGHWLTAADAYRQKAFDTWYGGWVQMRHETTLGPRPVTAVGVTTDAGFVYLEPRPLLYGRLAAMARQMIDGLESRDLLDEEAGQKLLEMERLLQGLEAVARKELSGQRLTEDEALLLAQTVERLSSLTTFTVAGEGDVPHIDLALPGLVDVYRDGSSGRLLQAALGDVWLIYLFVPGDEEAVLAAGAVFSSYELLGEQLRAEGWQSMERRPQPAPWIEPYVAP